MDYKISPYCSVWDSGIFTVPCALTDKYLKMASEYQLKSLLYLLRNNGKASSADIAKALGCTEADIDNFMEFWLEEGMISLNGEAPVPEPVKEDKPGEKPEQIKKESLSPPRLSPKDVTALLRDNKELRFLLTEAQRILGRSISHAEQEMLINMVNYYGLKVEVVLMILEFYRSEKQKGRSVGISYVTAMAKNWADEGVDSVSAAEEKLREIERSDRLWNEVTAMTGVKHRRPTVKQREMVSEWFSDFDITMISLACDIMKENISEPKLSYVNSILKKWKKQGVSSPADVKAQQEEFSKQKSTKGDGRLKGEASYDLEKIKKNSLSNTEL